MFYRVMRDGRFRDHKADLHRTLEDAKAWAERVLADGDADEVAIETWNELGEATTPITTWRLASDGIWSMS